MFALPCMLVCSFVSANRTRDRGCSKHPVFPAPSNFEEGNEDANLGQFMSRDREVFFRRMGRAKRNPSPSAPPLMGIASLHPSYGPAMTWRALCHTGSAIEYFTWLSAKLDSIDAMTVISYFAPAPFRFPR